MAFGLKIEHYGSVTLFSRIFREIVIDFLFSASFGTTKYCTYFLRNLPCNNPDCMYLHELGNEGDSFTKDEIASG